MDWAKTIRTCFEKDAVLYSNHARREMKEEPFGKIFEEEVCKAASSGEVIEEYRDDRPYPSVLVFGVTQANRPLHVVCAYDVEDDKLVIVTVYQPDPELWEEYRRRKI